MLCVLEICRVVYLWRVPEVKSGILDFDGIVVLAVSDSLKSGKVLVRDPVGALALDRDKAICGLIPCTLALRKSGYSRAGVENFIGLERLVFVGEFLRGFGVSLDVDGEEIGRVLFTDNTTTWDKVRYLAQMNGLRSKYTLG